MTRNFKSLVQSERTFLAGLLCLVGIVAFILGQYSSTASVIEIKNGQNQAGIIFIEAPTTVVPVDTITVVGSSGGTKFHHLDCPGAKSIKETNKIFFDSIELAVAAGYSPASNCDREVNF